MDLFFNYFEGFNEGMVGSEVELRGSMGKCEERQLEGGGEGVCEISVRLPMNNGMVPWKVEYMWVDM